MLASAIAALEESTIALGDLQEIRKVRIHDKLHGYITIHPGNVNMIEA